MKIDDYWLCTKAYNKWAPHYATSAAKFYFSIDRMGVFQMDDRFSLIASLTRPSINCFYSATHHTLWTFHLEGWMEFIPGREYWVDESIKSFINYLKRKKL